MNDLKPNYRFYLDKDGRMLCVKHDCDYTIGFRDSTCICEKCLKEWKLLKAKEIKE